MPNAGLSLDQTGQVAGFIHFRSLGMQATSLSIRVSIDRLVLPFRVCHAVARFQIASLSGAFADLYKFGGIILSYTRLLNSSFVDHFEWLG